MDWTELAWPWTESEKKRTKMQFWKIWDCFAIYIKKWTVFKRIRTNLQKHNTWTELQFLKMFGLKCKKNKIG